MRRGERKAWRDVAAAALAISAASDHAEEYMAKIKFREAWARMYGISGVSGLPRSAPPQITRARQGASKDGDEAGVRVAETNT